MDEEECFKERCRRTARPGRWCRLASDQLLASRARAHGLCTWLRGGGGGRAGGAHPSTGELPSERVMKLLAGEKTLPQQQHHHVLAYRDSAQGLQL